MRVSAAYLIVILIWSTTPLGIVWSSESINPTLAVLMRMIIALMLGSIILWRFRIKFPTERNAVKLYAYSGFGVFGGMLFAYLAAGYIASGLMSLVFGLSPILSGVMAQRITDEPKFSLIKKVALMIALSGLALSCYDSMALSNDGTIGILYVLIAMFLFSLSGVLVKSVTIKINPIATTVGSLLFCTPLLLIVWLIFDGSLPYQEWNEKSLWSVVYLGVIGSLLGFLAYFYILQKLNASTVALITMMTPILAMSLGAKLNDEIITSNLIFGALFVVAGLFLFQWGGRIKLDHRFISSHRKSIK